MAESSEDGVLSIEEVLAAEADEIAGEVSNITGGLKERLGGKEEQKKRFDRDFHLSADERDGTGVDAKTIEARKELYQRLNELKRGALCFSGGGIRSATFCLGILQALAACDADRLKKTVKKPDNQNDHKRHSDARTTPEDSLLGHFHYLSTVSGGGYIGSWLSAWRTRPGVRFADILDNLTTRPSGPDFEPPQISWLRAYSNYLTPRIGIGSADSWAAVAIVVRNLVLNWLIIIPVVCLVLLLLKLTATVSTWIAHGDVALVGQWIGDEYKGLPVIIVLSLGVIFLIVAQAFTTYHRPTTLRTDAPSEGKDVKCPLCRRDVKHEKCFLCRRINANDTCFFWGDLIWAVFSAIAITIFFSSQYFAGLFGADCQVPASVNLAGLTVGAKFALPFLAALAGFPLYAVGWLAGRPQTRNWRDWGFWAASGLVYGALVGFGAYLYTLLQPYTTSCKPSPGLPHLLVPIIFGVPWVLMSQLTADNIFGGLVSYEPRSDSDREWLGRAAGWLAAAAIAWAVVAFLVFAGGDFVQTATGWAKQFIVAAGGITGVISGIATALLGSSSDTPATSSSGGQISKTARIYNIGLALAGPIFAAVLIVALSVALDRVLLGESLPRLLQDSPPPQQTSTPSPQGSSLSLHDAAVSLQGASLSLQGGTVSLHGSALSVQGGTLSLQANSLSVQSGSTSGEHKIFSKLSILLWLLLGIAVLGLVAWIASVRVNINRFSLHALYRNRLIRAYLGATRDKRYPDRFTGFDGGDNVRMHDLWAPNISPRRLFHVVNIALNVVSTKRLAWQERKAESFTVSPRHCGSAYVGFRNSEDYGDSFTRTPGSGQGIALGTAMAISGAAVSPNMGYHSSPSITLLLTLFNVRLGWWLGNPGKAGDKDDAYKREGPRLAAKPLFYEAFGQTTDQSAYVYLSDGGHFENLGLYEMVRRRCRLIVVVDAGCDPKFAFEDLGNAVRKIYIDLGVRIKFVGLENLQNRPAKKDLNCQTAVKEKAAKKGAVREDECRNEIPYHAIGTIHYADADGDGCEDGTVIYIKPAYHGTEGAAVRSYATANKTFPHETTADQWFTESQFESYRALGLDIGHTVLCDNEVWKALHEFLKP